MKIYQKFLESTIYFSQNYIQRSQYDNRISYV